MTISVMLADDHELIREGLRRAFEREADFEVVAEAASVAEAIAVGRKTDPTVAIVDLRLPDGTGQSVVRCSRGRSERVRTEERAGRRDRGCGTPRGRLTAVLHLR